MNLRTLELMWSLAGKSIRLWGLSFVMWSEEWRCTLWARRMAVRMRHMHLRVESMRELLKADGTSPGTDSTLPQSLREWKDEIWDLRWSLNRMQHRGDGERLRSALLRAEQAAVAAHTSVDRLLWALQVWREAHPDLVAASLEQPQTQTEPGCGRPS